MLQTWLSGCTASFIISTLLRLVKRPSLCSASLTEPSQPHEPGFPGGGDALTLPKASRAQWEWQKWQIHHFTCWHLALQSHRQGCASTLRATGSSAPQPLPFSKSLHLSSPPLKTWEMSFARARADGIRLLLRGRAPPLPEHVPERKPLLQGLISPSQP